ncbi:type IV secretion system protein [uncultured Ruegeria sp.]|uniref:type IV secretion system protein n=1 Tax=uncultured Ruegeria sp. TaxID=259304 RepID=UPI0026139046|nr:type IV secretion system protein [uncultured Ruegeria sp.]
MNKDNISLASYILLAGLCLCVGAGMALGQPLGPIDGFPAPDPGVTPRPEVATEFGSGIIDSLRILLEDYSGVIGKTAKQLLFWLLAVDLVINVSKTVITGAGLPGFLSRFIYRFLVVLLAIFVIDNIAEIVEAVGHAAVRLARLSTESGSFVEPSVSGIIMDGIQNAHRILKEVSIWKPVSVFYVISAAVMLAVTAVQVAMIVVTYAELYLNTLAGLIVMAFAGLQNAEQSASRYIKTLIGKGLNLLTLLIVFSMFAQLFIDIAARDSTALGLDNLITMLILQLISMILMITLPSSVESLAGGAASSAAARIAGAAVAAGATKLAVAAGVGAVAGVAAGTVGGIAGGASSLAKGAGASSALTAGGKGAATAGARYARAGFSKSRSVTSEIANDGGRLAKDMRGILNRNRDSGD